MKITRLELTNFRMFKSLVLEDLPDFVVLVAPNGMGKSTILEAIAGAQYAAAPYDQQHPMPKVESLTDQGRTTGPGWPMHFPEPLRHNADSARIQIDFAITDEERSTHRQPDDLHTCIDVTLRNRRQIASVIRSQFEEFHKLVANAPFNDCVGFVDYLRPNRQYERRNVQGYGHIEEGSIRTEMSDFVHQLTRFQKGLHTKTFVSEMTLADWSHRSETNDARDSLATFRRVFDAFFAPKRFVGLRHHSGQRPQVLVRTPFGEMDIDDLSFGEKDVLNLLAHLFRFRDRQNIVLWDTPEAHLNAALEARLYDALRDIAPKNQYWIATHSVEIINSVPAESLFAIKNVNGHPALVRASDDAVKHRIELFRDLGASIGLQLVSNVVVFCEGRDGHGDKSLLSTLLRDFGTRVYFVAGGGCREVLAGGSRLATLLDSAVANCEYLAIIDRDFRNAGEVDSVRRKPSDHVFIWGVHEIENLFLQPDVVAETLHRLNVRAGDYDQDTIRSQLKTCAEDLRDEVAVQWASCELSRRCVSARSGAACKSAQDLQDYLKAFHERARKIPDESGVNELIASKRAEVDKWLQDDAWLVRMPGKELLTSFLHKHAQPVSARTYLSVAAVAVVDAGLAVPEIARLRKRLGQLLDRDRQNATANSV
jgi:predicted ATPase